MEDLDAMDIVVAEPDFIDVGSKAIDYGGAGRRLLDMVIRFTDPLEPAEPVVSFMLRRLPNLSGFINWNMTRRSYSIDAQGRINIEMDYKKTDDVRAFRELLRCLHLVHDKDLTDHLKKMLLTGGDILGLIVMASAWLHHSLIECAMRVLRDFVLDSFLDGENIESALEVLSFSDEVAIDKCEMSGLLRAGVFGLRFLSATDLDEISIASLARLPSEVLIHLIAFPGGEDGPRKDARFAQASLERLARIIAPRCMGQTEALKRRNRADIYLSNLTFKHAKHGTAVADLTAAISTLWSEERTTTVQRSRSSDGLAMARSTEPLPPGRFDISKILRLAREDGGGCDFSTSERIFIGDSLSNRVELYVRIADGRLSVAAMATASGGQPRELDAFFSIDIDPRLEVGRGKSKLVFCFHKQAPLPRGDSESFLNYALCNTLLEKRKDVVIIFRARGRVHTVTRPKSLPILTGSKLVN